MPERDYEKNLIRKPVYESHENIKGRQTPLTYMSPELVPGSPLHIDLSWIYDVPEPNPHTREHSMTMTKLYCISG